MTFSIFSCLIKVIPTTEKTLHFFKFAYKRNYKYFLTPTPAHYKLTLFFVFKTNKVFIIELECHVSHARGRKLNIPQKSFRENKQTSNIKSCNNKQNMQINSRENQN